MSNGTIIIGVDPGLAHFGFSVIHLQKSMETILQIGVFKTEPTKQKDVSKTEDLFVRAVAMATKLEWLIRERKVSAICAERFSYPPQASATAKMAITWGILGSMSARLGIPVITMAPQKIKQTLTGTTSAEKYEVEMAIRTMYEGSSSNAFKAFDQSHKHEDNEHAFDATAAAIAALDHHIIRAIRDTL